MGGALAWAHSACFTRTVSHIAGGSTLQGMNWLGLGSRNQRPLTPLQKFKAFYDIAKVSQSRC